MGFAMCTEYCEPEDVSQPINITGANLEGLSFQPLPAAAAVSAGKAMLGARLPIRPRPAIPDALLQEPESNGQIDSAHGVTCGRPGEPLNKVCLLLSNDLEGFLPYTLIISEEIGLEFTSLTPAPRFVVDPGDIVKASQIGYDALLQDRSFSKLCRSISARYELQAASMGWSLEDRVRPPYIHTVHLVIRQEQALSGSEGGGSQPTELTLLVAVQTEPLAEELAKSCILLRKRRALSAGYWQKGTPALVPSRENQTLR
eukprot:TRINITY_DN6928_c0_g1_i2.p1 TRINITY_DN6928_c0_g1~~TRINITY_DN6928_c0_g1_i2.p1  ORF type:complete len:258 (-),score=38.49 TRINITY_DN6928_c0_g1_i2:111-884(-)